MDELAILAARVTLAPPANVEKMEAKGSLVQMVPMDWMASQGILEMKATRERGDPPVLTA